MVSGESARADANKSGVGLTPQLRMAMPPFAAIRAFEAVGTCGGIRRAAQALSLDHAAVSRHLRMLEAWAGVPLLNRVPGSAGGTLTPQGALFHQRICSGLAEIARASLDLTRKGVDGSLRLWCAPGLASEWLAKRLGNLADAVPNADLELNSTEEQPDFSVHEVDACLHYIIFGQQEPPSDQRLRSIEIVRPPTIAVASPAYIVREFEPKTPADLLQMRLLHETGTGQWMRWLSHYQVVPSGKLSGPSLGQGHLTISAARRGQGVALANALLIEDDLSTGALVRLGAWEPVALGAYHFTARRDRWRDDVITSVRRWLEKSLSASLAQAFR